MNLSLNFTLEELTKTNYKLSNVPNPEQLENLKALANNCLQPIRDEFGAIRINSGFRSTLVNKMAKGAPTSQHTKGEAADIDTDKNKEIFDWIRKNLQFDQLINENNYSWIHISYKKSGNRNEVLELKNGKYIKV